MITELLIITSVLLTIIAEYVKEESYQRDVFQNAAYFFLGLGLGNIGLF